jgi:hypothetical protein
MKTGEFGQVKIEKIPGRAARVFIPPSSHFSTCSAARRNRDERGKRLYPIFPILL